MPNATMAYAMLRQEEKQRETSNPQFLTLTVMYTINNTRSSYNNNSVPNTRHTRKGTVPNTTKSSLKPGVICGNWNNGSNKSNFKPRSVNTETGQTADQEGTLTNELGTSRAKADDAVFAKMDSLQNQLNQVMMILQNYQGKCDPKLLAAGRYLFIASCVSLFKDAWVVMVEPLIIYAFH
ncbi:hypothetical protein Tco_0959536 [Tanacetum coccineum]